MKIIAMAALGACLMLGTANAAQGATAERVTAGVLRDGTAVEAVELRSATGVSARVLTYGATLQSLIAPDRDGRTADVVLGFETPAEYADNQTFLGATIGRFANRIAKGRFTIDGQSYQLPLNNGANTLHGGGQGFDRSVWSIASIKSGPQAAVTLKLTSPDGASGYPGEVTASVTYALDDLGALTITFDATTTKPTILNLTNHALFNMAGAGASQGAMENRLTMPASTYTPSMIR